MRDMPNEKLRLLERPRRLFGRHFDAGAGLIVGNSFEIVGMGEETTQGGRKIRIILRQALKLLMYALVRFNRPAGLLGNESLRRMEPRQISGAPRRIIKGDLQNGLGFQKQSVGLAEELRRFRRHRSRPSRRISRMSGERSE
jgi:hypothetical protein